MFHSGGSDYSPPSDRFVIEAGETSDCLTFTIFDDGTVEGMESLTGFLEGIFNPDDNTLNTSPDRITFDPQQATLDILDTDGMDVT